MAQGSIARHVSQRSWPLALVMSARMLPSCIHRVRASFAKPRTSKRNNSFPSPAPVTMLLMSAALISTSPAVFDTSSFAAARIVIRDAMVINGNVCSNGSLMNFEDCTAEFSRDAVSPLGSQKVNPRLEKNPVEAKAPPSLRRCPGKTFQTSNNTPKKIRR